VQAARRSGEEKIQEAWGSKKARLETAAVTCCSRPDAACFRPYAAQQRRVDGIACTTSASEHANAPIVVVKLTQPPVVCAWPLSVISVCRFKSRVDPHDADMPLHRPYASAMTMKARLRKSRRMEENMVPTPKATSSCAAACEWGECRRSERAERSRMEGKRLKRRCEQEARG
jgi:hypothetical protein